MKLTQEHAKIACFLALVVGACNGQLLVDAGDGAAGAPSGADAKPWTGNDPDCPASVPGDVPCGTEGEICAYRYPDDLNAGHIEYQACACWEVSSAEMRFNCYDTDDSLLECPDQEPLDGASCFGLLGTSCKYPERTLCTCSEGTGAWSCEEEVLGFSPPPAPVPPDRAVDALSDVERAAWCDWYATSFHGAGYPLPPEPSVGESGYTGTSTCYYSGSPAPTCAATVPEVGPETCDANLALSTCNAPISELSDCVLTVMNLCWPSPHGCARFFDRPGCSGTIVTDLRTETGGTNGGPAGGSGTSTGGTSGTGSNDPSQPANCSIRVR